ncbi:lysostaphin resistance A-like protein [Sphingomonas sp.]|uniref:CPBP family intramembrane glutamic endopeptidase n=1 Tax=Sphingomonas sp. TaxID=28214 RepID=UPI0035BC7B60
MNAAGRPFPVLIAAVIAGGAVVSAAMLLAPALGATLADWSPAGQEALFSGLLYGVLALIAVLGRRLAGLPDSTTTSRALWIAVGAAIGIGGLMLALGDATLAGAVARGPSGGGIGTLLIGTLVVAGQSASEELFFRGWLQPVLARSWHIAAAIGVTAIAFAALHIAGGARTPLTLVNLLLGGILFGLLAWRSGGLAAPIAAHAGWNWAEGIVFGLDPNPGTGGFGALHDLDMTGAARWGGSAEGLNASVAMTLVLVALILPLAMSAARPPIRSISVPG